MSKQTSANDPMIGTWKLNVSKSTYTPGPVPKSATNRFEPWEDGMKATIDVVDGQGNNILAEVTAKFDGKDYPVKGSPIADAVSLKRVNERQIEIVWKKGGKVAMGGDGQVSIGDTIVKAQANKIRALKGGKVLAGFAGSVADAITLYEKFEEKLDRYPGNLPRASVELAKDWRGDRVLRRLEALLIVADVEHTFLLSGAGELIEPDDGILAIGSGGNYALAAARALASDPTLSARDVVQRSLEIAADICVFTNRNLTILEL